MALAHTSQRLAYGLRPLVEELLSALENGAGDIEGLKPVSGGCIHHVLQIDTAAHRYCLKWAEPHQADMLAREVQNLGLMRETQTVASPQIYHHGDTEQGAYFILMQWLEPELPRRDTWSQLGRQLAAMHRHTQPHFGLHYDNYIGLLPQHNQPHADWPSFFIQERLEPQVKWAAEAGRLDRELRSRFRRLYSRLDQLLTNEPASLLHGDLWSGNILVGPEGRAFLIDPATYYGHRECDLAFTQLFGRLEDAFYDAYQEEYPLEPGYQERFQIWNLYPLMVHVNLFGSSYLSAVRNLLGRL